LQEIHAQRTANEYIKTYFKPCRDPSTRSVQWVAEKSWVLEALISNKIQRNKSINNMRAELFIILRATGYDIVEVEEPASEAPEDQGCEAISLDSEGPPDVTTEQQRVIESEINALCENEQLEMNLQYWQNGHPSSQEDALRLKYVRFRVDFPQCQPSMETFREIETVRPQLFRIACITMLDDNAMNNYLIRDKRSTRLEELLRQLTAIRILFGALLGVSDISTLMRLGLPQKLEGHIIHQNINKIIQELRNTMFIKTLGIRLQTRLKGGESVDNKLRNTYIQKHSSNHPKPR
jgi:hypothetical protein